MHSWIYQHRMEQHRMVPRVFEMPMLCYFSDNKWFWVVTSVPYKEEFLTSDAIGWQVSFEWLSLQHQYKCFPPHFCHLRSPLLRPLFMRVSSHLHWVFVRNCWDPPQLYKLLLLLFVFANIHLFIFLCYKFVFS